MLGRQTKNQCQGSQGPQTRTPASERHGRHGPRDNDLTWVQGGSTGESPRIMNPREAQVRPCPVTADRNKPSLGHHPDDATLTAMTAITGKEHTYNEGHSLINFSRYICITCGTTQIKTSVLNTPKSLLWLLSILALSLKDTMTDFRYQRRRLPPFWIS